MYNLKIIEMKNLFVSYEVALKLKELGFDEECFGEYIEGNNNIPILDIYQEIDYAGLD